MRNQDIYELCRSPVSISSELAKTPTATVASIAEGLYGHHGGKAMNHDGKHEKGSPSDLDLALASGKWGDSSPSNLFLQIYADVLKTLHADPLGGVCSPSLLGSNGVCPLTVIAPIPDICRHMSNLIARAETSVFLATNYWALSEGSRLISNAFKELSRRSVAAGRHVTVKIVYDRGDLKQVVDHHQMVPPENFSDPKGKIGLPHPNQIPNVAIEVQNYHQPIFGTFHAKFMIVDRRIAITQSNNIQDNDNLEMMAQWEGDIVDSLYDMALITWHKAMNPPMQCLPTPATGAPTPSSAVVSFQSLFDPQGRMQLGSSRQQTTPQTSEGVEDLKSIAAQASVLQLPQHTSHDAHYDSDIAAEVIRSIAALTSPGEGRIEGISRLLNGPAPDNQTASAPEVAPEDMMTPIIPIAPHAPFPMAMVNRPPYGPLGHSSVHVPQNAAFSSALRNATSSVFIQTPDLNAEALLPEILSACRRGINVTYYYCLGYNDAGELLPKQGGHNESIAHHLYTELEPQHHDNLNIYAYVAKDQIRPIHNKFKKRSCHIKLMIVDDHIAIQGSGNQDTQSWYHSQEVNVLIDSEIVCRKWIEGICQNQNTPLYGKTSKEGDKAGCWIDKETGKMADGAIGIDAGRFASLKGIVGAVNRVRGVGGF